MLKGWDGVMGMALLWMGGILAGMALVEATVAGMSSPLAWLAVAFSAAVTWLGVLGTRAGV